MPNNEPTPQEITDAYTSAARKTLAEGLHKIEHCINQLDDTQLWYRPRPEMNSIANLMLHLSGNLRQWIISGIGGAKDIRNRPQEFADRSNRKKEQVASILKQTVAEADAAMKAITPSMLLFPRRIQGHDVNAIEAIERIIPHFRGHVQEIIHMTRQQLGDNYKFDFVPKGKEQQSASGPGI